MVSDLLARPLRSLRVSLTDRCNLRCRYCMPHEEYAWLPREHLLSFEEIERLAGVFASLGVTKLRLTGGEPLLRRDLHVLVRALSRIPGLADLALTTNGTRLAEWAAPLRAAGLGRLTVSLDTLRPERFQALTRRAELDAVLRGVAAAAAAGFSGTKIDTVVMRGVNDDELPDLIEFGRARALEVRFIEYMDVGGATEWSAERVVSKAEILARLSARYGPVAALARHDWAPAERFALADGTAFGVISSTTEPFCRTCDRSRLTADGTWFLCLYARAGLDLRALVRGGASDAELRQRIAGAWLGRSDRGAELRLAAQERAPLYAQAELQADPHLEMHTRGG